MYIRLDNISIHANHGVMPQERTIGGDFEVDLRVGYDYSAALISDDVSDTLDYSRLYLIVKEEMEEPSNLLEHVAGRIASHIINDFPKCTSIDIEIRKIAPPFGGKVSAAAVELHVENNG